jgi:cytochrome bd-type quinol oxidase subunit 1/mono/diheme cytochrome c family protein
MNYPAWDVPLLGGAWIIGLIAIFHIPISHFAVGGGLLLPVAEARALRAGRQDWLAFLARHSRFFLILTGVFGALSGVGIWFAIGLAAPEATSTLIHNFVFGWAIEWVFFVIELAAAAVYYYTWNRIPARLHLQVGWVYAAASFMTLVIINGILTFMLTPGASWLDVAGTGQESSRFFQALFNPTYWPSLALRTLVCASLAAVWTLVMASRIDGDKEPELKTSLVRWSVGWLLPGFFLMPFCLLWYLSQVPEAQRGLLTLGISTIGAGTFTAVTRTVLVSVMASATIVAVAYLVAYRQPREFRLGHACALLGLAVAATASSEYSREMLRKPYVVGEHMYSNAVRKTAVRVGEHREYEVERFREVGYLAKTIWARDEERQAWETADQAAVPAGSAADRATPESSPALLARGELMFRGQCLACHTLGGYRSLTRLLRDRDYQSITNILRMLREPTQDSPYRKFMPPLVGTDAEVQSLAVYLSEQVAGRPAHD